MEMEWRGRQSEALLDETPYLDIEGALGASKTTLGLWKVINDCLAYPGMPWMISRWTDDATMGLLRPRWREICAQAGIHLTWHTDEQYDMLENGSFVYVRGLKASEGSNRYGKFRGLNLGGVYVDQAEEIPTGDYVDELKQRLRFPNVPHRLILTPNPPPEDHWIAKMFPESNNIRDHKYIRLSLYDNAHNLPQDFVEKAERNFPPGHAKYGPVIMGTRGLNVTGQPVYAGAFRRGLHVRPTTMNPQLPLYEVLDFGKHHPCVLWSQFDPWGGWTWLGGIMGQDVGLGDFCRIVQNYRQQWFPDPLDVQWACDPAGTHDNSHGTQTAISVLNEHDIHPRWAENSNAPVVRRGCIERTAEYMRRRHSTGECFSVDDQRWLVIGTTELRPTQFAAQALEAGYVWDERSRTTAGGKSIVVPLKDGWFEHVMNCAEYTELNFGQGRLSVVQMERQSAKIHSAQLKRSQQDGDPYRNHPLRSARRGGY